MKVNIKTKIKYNGQEYSSVEELPPEARSAYEKAMATGSASLSKKIVFNGQEYASLEQMPAAQRRLYEDAVTLSQDSQALAPERKAAGLLTKRQWQLVLFFAALVVTAVVILLLKH